MATIDQSPLVMPRYSRAADAIAGPFYVTNQCLICGLPVETAPKNISWSENQLLRQGGASCPNSCRVTKQPETTEELERMLEALEGSCVQAIRYCGTNEDILEKLKARGLAHLCDALS